jgi:hypothetical protein
MKTLTRLTTGFLSILLLILSHPANASFTAVSAGRYYHSCALTYIGTVKCWGYNEYGQLGDGTSGIDRLTPVPVTGVSSVTAISVGSRHTCALTITDTVKCWGYNEYGQLGDDTTTDRLTPITVSGLSGVTAVSAGDDLTCALINTGTVKCWGVNAGGGDVDDIVLYTSTPETVIDLTGVTAISANLSDTCALTTAGEVKCWNEEFYDYDPMGDDPIDTSIRLISVSGVTAISNGGNHTCALTNTGSVKCWGYNGSGQLGDGTGTDSLMPVDVIDSDATPYLNGLVELLSVDTKDGWLLESTETSKKGGKAGSTTTLIVGDSSKNQEYRSIVHFDTASLPDNAVITKATLTLEKQSVKGNVKPLGNLVVDIKQKNFGSTASLKANDFEAKAGKISVGAFKVSGDIYGSTYYSAVLNTTGKTNISKTAATQFKIHFTKDDNNDKGDDYLKFYSGNASSSSRPSLVIEYYVP